MTSTHGPSPQARVLLVDDDRGVLTALNRLLSKSGAQTRTASSGVEALALLEGFQPDVVISDHRMPDMGGVEFLTQVKARLPHTQRILLTGEADPEAIESAIAQSQVFRLIFKPWNDAQLLLTVRSALEHRALAVELERMHRLTRDRNVELEARVQQRTEALSLAKAEWEATFDTLDSPLAVVRLDDLVVRRANRAAAKVNHFPLTSLNSGVTCHQLLFGRASPCAGCPVGPELKAPATIEVEHEGRTWVIRAQPMEGAVVAVCHYREVTEERRLLRQLVESEKMSAIGSLAGGVAHEINNPLAGILGFSQIMKRQPNRSAEDQESLAVIEESAQRCKRIVGSLLQLSRRSRLEDRRLFDLTKCVDDSVTLFRGEAKRHPHLKLNLKLDPELPEVFGDPSQLGQVVLNLLQNALQALPNSAGEIDVETGRKDGACAFSVRDTGTGIAPEHLSRIFDPHFTTKPPGEGTGLGLAIALRIVTDHGGHLTVDTALNRGTIFTAVIPVAPTREAA